MTITGYFKLLVGDSNLTVNGENKCSLGEALEEAHRRQAEGKTAVASWPKKAAK